MKKLEKFEGKIFKKEELSTLKGGLRQFERADGYSLTNCEDSLVGKNLSDCTDKDQ